ncbi:hypothetical protein GY45DRAFT_1332028 [Cubamyces sp. BRFM 1775]|nr:hypothetical protein GY45DRAFT_1332028 [Cubamyces sp. BRFM 1775]
MARTNRRLLTAAAHQNSALLRLPYELLREIFMYYDNGTKETKRWLASIATICKALQPDVEAVLYRTVETLYMFKHLNMFYRGVAKEPHRATAVRSLHVVAWTSSAGIKTTLKRLFKQLTGLVHLKLIAQDTEMYNMLLDVPFQLCTLVAGGSCSSYPPRFEDILARHPTLRMLHFYFPLGESGEAVGAPNLTIARPDILPNLQKLIVNTSLFSMSRLQYAYPKVTHLCIGKVTHDDVNRAITLFGSNLVSFKLFRSLGPQCTDSCYWPTSMLQNKRLPKLLQLEIVDVYDREDVLPGDPEYIPVVPGLSKSCPALRKFIWSVDSDLMDDLNVYLGDPSDDRTLMDQYALMLFRAFRTLQRVGFVDQSDKTGAYENFAYGEVYFRSRGRIRLREYGVVSGLTEWYDVPHNDLASVGCVYVSGAYLVCT